MSAGWSETKRGSSYEDAITMYIIRTIERVFIAETHYGVPMLEQFIIISRDRITL